MGNASSGGFDIGEKIEYNENKHWTVNAGLRKEGEKEAVTIFSFAKKQYADKLLPAQRCIQKAKTLKHPFIVSYIESADYEESLVLVTEQCKPLEAWLSENTTTRKTSEELLWGFRCVLDALQFLHNNGLTHGYLGLHAIFVTKGGDMKLGALDLVANMTVEDDLTFLRTYIHLLNKPYLAPERQDVCRSGNGGAGSSSGKGKAAGAEADIFALAYCMQTAFNKADLEAPASLSKYFARMMSADPAKRPSASQLLKCPVFNSDDVKLLLSLGELAGLPVSGQTDILQKLSSHVESIPPSICVHKVLPCVSMTLSMASTDFTNRDARESCRQSIHLSLNLLSQLATAHKIDEETFTGKCLPGVLQLWTMTDRAVRTSLLGTLKPLVAITPASAVNKSIFDQLLAGFADSNAKMREDTLKCLVHVVDKLDEKHLQEKLVRCIVNLQADTEASIRTNATIFLGRIAGKLKEGVRVRVLGQAFLKALRDQFVHCRIAGLKATVACVSYLDHNQLTTKILPQACVLLLDRSHEIRELALGLLDQSLVIMKTHHTALTAAEKKAAAEGKAGQSGSSSSSSSSAGGTVADDASSGQQQAGASSWTSWVAGPLKTLEKATGNALTQATTATAASSSSLPINDSNQSLDSEKEKVSAAGTSSSSRSTTSAVVQKAPPAAAAVKDGWDNDWGDMDLDGNGVDEDENGQTGGNNNSSSSSCRGDGWGDDDDIDIDGEEDLDTSSASSSAKPPPVVPKGLAPSAALQKKMNTEAAKKPSAKKLGIDQDESWDDF